MRNDPINYSYRRGAATNGLYEIGYRERGRFIVVKVVSTYEEVLDFINEKGIG